jgi:hypothetical protein
MPSPAKRLAASARNDSPCDWRWSGTSPYSDRSGEKVSWLSTNCATLKKLSARRK